MKLTYFLSFLCLTLQQQFNVDSPFLKSNEDLEMEKHNEFSREIDDKDDIFSSESTDPLLIYNSLYKINGGRNPHKYAVNYLKSGKYIDWHDEVIIMVDKV